MAGANVATKGRVELHVHLDGSVRPATVLEFAKKKKMSLPADNVAELVKHTTCQDRGTLRDFLSKFSVFLPPLAGDAEAVRRIAYEFCEDAAKSHIVYVEVRYCPHILASKVTPRLFAPADGDLTPKDVVRIVQQGLQEGSRDFKVKVKSILCCISHFKEWSLEIVELCDEFRNEGVVAIDVAGDATGADEEPYDMEHVIAFKTAKQLGIHRTAHAGENGPPSVIKHAVDSMFVQRIGHGYHVVQDEELYEQLIKDHMHFECCPISSWYTGSAPEDFTKHPIIRFIKDGVNFSISTDDPIVLGNTLSDDYTWCVEKFGMTEKEVIRSNFRAAEASFLPENEKKELIAQLSAAYKGYETAL